MLDFNKATQEIFTLRKIGNLRKRQSRNFKFGISYLDSSLFGKPSLSLHISLCITLYSIFTTYLPVKLKNVVRNYEISSLAIAKPYGLTISH